ncbi:MAG: MFS transporter [Anaeromyxobacter sp.]
MTHPPEPQPDRSNGRALALGLALGAAFLARGVMGPLVGQLRAGLWLNDQALGSLLAAFAAAYAAALPLTAALAERRPRPQLLAWALLCCAAGTALSSAGVGFWTLAVARALAGAGAGAATALAAGLLRDAGPLARRRAAEVGVLAPAAGLAAGYVLGGLAPAWRLAFLLAGAGIAATALLARRTAEAPRGADAWAALRAAGWRAAVRSACGHRTGGLVVAAAAAGAFGAGGLAFWLPSYLERARSVPRHVAGAQLAALVLMAGALGAVLTPALARTLARRSRAPNGWTAAAAAAGAAGGAWLAFAAATPALYLPGLGLALLGVVVWTRATLAAFERGAAGAEPAAVAVGALAAHGLGDLLAAPAMGAVSDGASFVLAVQLLPAALLTSALLWALAAWSRGRARPAQAADDPRREVA